MSVLSTQTTMKSRALREGSAWMMTMVLIKMRGRWPVIPACGEMYGARPMPHKGSGRDPIRSFTYRQCMFHKVHLS
jgi:hypothetical protein